MSGESMMTELHELFVQGRDMPAPLWRERLRRRAFRELAQKLVWQADGVRFMPGDGVDPAGPVSLAHPVELDAGEILCWRAALSERGIVQPFMQMWEPVVLRDGRLPGRVRQVQSAGEKYRMLDRYAGCHLPLEAVPGLEPHGFRFIVRRRWDRDRWKNAEIQVVNVVTPAGILYECRPDRRVENLEPQGDACLALHGFYPFEGIRLRTLNHVAAVLENCMLTGMARRDALDMLLPHLPGMPEARLAKLLRACGGETDTARLLRKLIERKGGGADDLAHGI